MHHFLPFVFAEDQSSALIYFDSLDLFDQWLEEKKLVSDPHPMIMLFVQLYPEKRNSNLTSEYEFYDDDIKNGMEGEVSPSEGFL